MGRKSIDDIRKPQILEHFRAVTNREGIHKASVAKIAKRMEVSPNLVLHYFASKKAMVFELLDHIMDKYLEFLREAIQDIPIGPARFKTLIKTMFGDGMNQDLLIEKSFYALYYLSLFDDEIKSRFNSKYIQFIDIVAQEVDSFAKFQGVDQAGSKKQAEFVLSLFEGFSFSANVRQQDDYIKENGGYFIDSIYAMFKC
jgi:AcrR family transcriptional regulator